MGARRRAVASDYDQTVDIGRSESLGCCLAVLWLQEALTAARTENGPTQPAGGIHVPVGSNPVRTKSNGEIYEAPVHKTLVPLFDPNRFQVVGGGNLRHRPKGSVHAGGIPAGGESRDASHITSVGADP